MPLHKPVHTLRDSVRVGEAASILGVSAKTLRNWDRTGKLKARRHPINRYRVYLRDELLYLLNRTAEPSQPASIE
jgi:predicted site-specific integrase-resolvase